MRVLLTPVLATLAATSALAQTPADVPELERLCNRTYDDPRQASLEALDARAAQENGARASYLRGCRHLAERKFGPAGTEFEKAVKADPQVAIYHFWFGRATGEQAQRANVLRQPGLARRTKGEFEKAAELDPSYIPAREGLVRFYIAAPGLMGGSFDRAREQAEAITRINPYRGGLAHANVALARRDTAGLIRTHEGLAAQFPDSTVPLFALYNIHSSRQQWAPAWSVIDRLERIRPDLAVVKYAVGRAAAQPPRYPVLSVQSPVVLQGTVENARSRLRDNRRFVNQHAVELHKKFAISVACTIFVLVGAPIALRFPRGGVGLVIGVSLTIFGIYYVGLIAGEALADRNVLTPFLAMWAANILLTAVGLALLARMGRESATTRGGDLGEMLEIVRHLFVRRRAPAGAGTAR